MEEQRYTVVFRGTNKGSADGEQTKQRVGLLLRISHSECDRLFNSRSEVVLKRRVTLQQAKQLQKLLTKAGADCGIHPCESLDITSPLPQLRNIFKCHACGYRRPLEKGELPPGMCPSCRVIVANKKTLIKTEHERASIRENLKNIRAQEARAYPAASEMSATEPPGRHYMGLLPAAAGLAVILFGVTLLFALFSQDQTAPGEMSVQQVGAASEVESELTPNELNNLAAPAAGLQE